MDNLKFVVFFTVFIFCSAQLFSQQKEVQKTDSIKLYKLSDVVITATKTSANTLELANSISIIDSSEIANKSTNGVLDLLKNEYGLNFTSQGGSGTLSNIYLRGGSPSYTHVLIDGVEMNLTNDPSGVYDFASLSTNGIERIEVLRGPQSILYGSDAMGGVINIITRKGAGLPSIYLSTEGGSYNTFSLNTGISGVVSDFNFLLDLGRLKSDGFSAANEKYGNTEKDGFQKDNVISILGYKLNKDFSVNLYGRYLNSNAEYDQSGINGDDPTYKFDQEEFFVRAEGLASLFNEDWNQKLGISFLRNTRKYNFDETLNNPTASRSLYDGRKIKTDWQNNFALFRDNLISVGVDFEYEEVTSEYLSFSSSGDFQSIFPKSLSKTFGFYLQDQIKFSKDFFASAGVRIDNHDQFGNSFTYRIAPAYIFWKTGTKLKATIGTGFKAPSLFYLYDPAFGNPELNSEKSFGWDAGVEQFLWNEGLSIGVTYFNNDYKDLFGFDENFKAININKAKTNGIELFTTAKPFEGFLAKINYTFTSAEDISEGTAEKDKKLLRRPEHKAGAYLSYSFLQKINVNTELIYVSDRDDKDFSTFPATRLILEKYFLLNFAANYNVADLLRFNIRIENILDSEYEDVFGYGTAGISFYGGIKLTIR